MNIRLTKDNGESVLVNMDDIVILEPEVGKKGTAILYAKPGRMVFALHVKQSVEEIIAIAKNRVETRLLSFVGAS